jgi:hypothetical protein
MRKTLLIAAAALAASVISSQAQVYSQNIVGYVNVPIAAGYNNISIPLDSAGGNYVTNTIPNSGALDGDPLFIFNGHSFNQVTFDSGMASGFGDASDTSMVPCPIINPGVAFYINANNGGPTVTNTFVGTVHTDFAATGAQVVGSTTNIIPAGKQFYSSKLPIGGGITSVLQFANVASALDGDVINLPNIVGGAIHGYTQVVFDSGMGTGFGDASDTSPVAEPVIPVASGFLFDNNNGNGTATWTQAL